MSDLSGRRKGQSSTVITLALHTFSLCVCVCILQEGKKHKRVRTYKGILSKAFISEPEWFFDFECILLINLILNVLQFSLQLHADFKAKKN